jgi:hypothetical protein
MCFNAFQLFSLFKNWLSLSITWDLFIFQLCFSMIHIKPAAKAEVAVLEVPRETGPAAPQPPHCWSSPSRRSSPPRLQVASSPPRPPPRSPGCRTARPPQEHKVVEPIPGVPGFGTPGMGHSPRKTYPGGSALLNPAFRRYPTEPEVGRRTRGFRGSEPLG